MPTNRQSVYHPSMTSPDIPLTKRSCSRANNDSAPLGKTGAAMFMDDVPQWKLSDDGSVIMSTFALPDFKRAVAFINLVAALSEKENHHPDMFLHDYNSVSITLTTRSAGGLTENDFILAAKIDALLEQQSDESV